VIKLIGFVVAHPILLYDGVCGLCNRLVQFILRHDRAGIFRFAALQSPLAAAILARHGADATELDTVYVVLNYEPNANDQKQSTPTSGVELRRSEPAESLLSRSDAFAFVLSQLGGWWAFIGAIIRMVPRFIRNWGYNLVARTRYRIFGHYDTCPLPTPETRSRFLDMQ
jgi:predicted DCC family thiol-disulfide oxidoreductase YuxK